MINVVDHVLRLQGIESNCSREVSARRWDEGFQTEWSGVGPDGEEGVEHDREEASSEGRTVPQAYVETIITVNSIIHVAVM